MKLQRRFITMAALLAAVGAAGLSGRAEAKPGDPPQSVAVVDTDTVSAAMRKTETWKRVIEEARAKRATLEASLNQARETRFLTDAERKRVDDLRAKTKPTEKDKAELTTLLGKSDEIQKEFEELAQKTNTNALEKQRLADLNGMMSQAGARLRTQLTTAQQQVQEIEGELRVKTREQLLKIVAEVAKDEKVDVIVDRSAILFGGLDLTDKVIKRLPK